MLHFPTAHAFAVFADLCTGHKACVHTLSGIASDSRASAAQNEVHLAKLLRIET